MSLKKKTLNGNKLSNWDGNILYWTINAFNKVYF